MSTDVVSWQLAVTGSILTTGGTFLGTVIVESDLTTILAAVLSAAVAGQSADAFSVGSSSESGDVDWNAVGTIFGVESIYNFLVLLTIGLGILFQSRYKSKVLGIRQLISLIIFVITMVVFFGLTAIFANWKRWWVRFLVITVVGTLIFSTTYVLETLAFPKFKSPSSLRLK